MRALNTALIMGFLAACAPAIPESGAGVGFDNSEDAQRAREVALNTGQPLVSPSVLSDEQRAASTGSFVPAGQVPAPSSVSSQPLSATSVSSNASADIAAETAAALAAVNTNSGQVPLQASPSNPTPGNNTGISDENNFAAVSSRQSISSDADRIAANRAQYQVIAPTALPTRAGNSGPNIVDYALSSNNPVGARVYSRSGFNGSSKAARNCARFASPDQAQLEFLSQGGPIKDRKGLDPDGDGYACTWDPGPFRRAANN